MEIEEWTQNCIQQIIDEEYFVDSSKWVAKFITKNSNMTVQPHEALRIMKENMGMKYKKITKASVHLNSSTNLILRQQWAVEYFNLWK